MKLQLFIMGIRAIFYVTGRAKFARDTLVGKVDENTAIVTADIFDPEGMKQALSDPELGKSFEEMGIEHTIYMLQPAPVPGS